MADMSGKLFDSGGGPKECCTRLAFRITELLTAPAKPFVGEREHAFEEFPVSGSQEWRKSVRCHRLVIGIEKGVRLALAAAELENAVGPFENRADQHVPVGMDEIEGRSQGNAEESILECDPRGRLARLVHTQHDMEVVVGIRKLQHPAGEMAVAKEVEATDSHDHLLRSRETTLVLSC